MTFDKCSVRGNLFGYVMDEAGNEISDHEVRPPDRIGEEIINGSRRLEIETFGIRRERR